jgi:hypothetical protein
MWKYQTMSPEKPKESVESRVQANVDHARTHFSLDRQTDAGLVRGTVDENIRASFITNLNLISEIAGLLAKEIDELRVAIAELKNDV